MSIGNYTIDSPITVAVDGFTSIKLKNILGGRVVSAVVYISNIIEPVDCIGGNAEAMNVQ